MVKRIFLLIIPLLLLAASPVARADVHDNAGIFSQQAIDQADAAIDQMQQKYHKDFAIETYAKVPDNLLNQLKQMNKEEFFRAWINKRANALQTNGVFALICMDPKYIDVLAGKETRARNIFTDSDLNRLRQQMQSDFHNGQFDQGLLDGVNIVERAYANIPYRSGNSSTNYGNQPAIPIPNTFHTSNGNGLGSLICLGIGALLIFSLIRSVLSGRSSYGGGYGNFGGYGPGPGYGGYGGYGGGGGFGTGLMGGLLGGVLGGEADRWMHGSNQSGGYQGGGGGFGGGSSGGLGGFDSGPSDAGQGFGGGSGGGDFGASGGGGGGGGDSGGGF